MQFVDVGENQTAGFAFHAISQDDIFHEQLTFFIDGFDTRSTVPSSEPDIHTPGIRWRSPSEARHLQA